MSARILLLSAGLLLVGLSACGDLGRSNPYDPGSGVEVNTDELLIGTWTREAAGENRIYVFKRDGRVELFDYSSPSGGTVDRDAGYPLTLVISYSGTYTLNGNLLRLSFTGVQTSDPSGVPPSLPSTDRVVSILVDATALTLAERDGNRTYTRLD